MTDEVSASEFLRDLEPHHITDGRGNPGLAYTGQNVVDAFKAGAILARQTRPASEGLVERFEYAAEQFHNVHDWHREPAPEGDGTLRDWVLAALRTEPASPMPTEIDAMIHSSMGKDFEHRETLASDDVERVIAKGNERGLYDISKLGPEAAAYFRDRAGMLANLRDEMSEGYRDWLDDAVQALERAATLSAIAAMPSERERRKGQPMTEQTHGDELIALAERLTPAQLEMSDLELGKWALRQLGIYPSRRSGRTQLGAALRAHANKENDDAN